MADVLSRRPTDFVEDEMERMIRRFFGRPLFSVSGEGFWHPPVDIHLTDKSVLVRLDIPGIDPKEVEISIEDNRLLVRGKRTACKSSLHSFKVSAQASSAGWYYSSFQREGGRGD